MKGGIYTRERCPICGGKFIDNHRDGLICPVHQNVRAINIFVKFGKIYKRTRSYDQAFRWLTGFRFKTDETTFDERDYRKDNPLGFTNVSDKYISHKQSQGRKSWRDIANHIRHAQRYFDQTNVKDLRYGHFEDLLRTLALSNKTKANIMSDLHAMFVWLKKRQMIHNLPEFPSVEYQLGYRKTVDKATQIAIIDELKRIAPTKVYLGIKWLATYISVRPAEMINLKEGDIDSENGYLYFPHPKEKKFKSVPILDSDIETLRGYSKTFSSAKFFRHEGGVQGTVKDEPFGRNYFYKWWKRACSNLKITGVDLYGGTRHSTARSLRHYRTPEEIRRATMSATNKAFERYYKVEADELRNVYADAGRVIEFPQPATKAQPSKTT